MTRFFCLTFCCFVSPVSQNKLYSFCCWFLSITCFKLVKHLKGFTSVKLSVKERWIQTYRNFIEKNYFHYTDMIALISLPLVNLLRSIPILTYAKVQLLSNNSNKVKDFTLQNLWQLHGKKLMVLSNNSVPKTTLDTTLQK